MIDIEKRREQLLEEINKLTPVQLSKLCVRVTKEILNRDSVDVSIEHNFKQTKKVLVNLIIEHDIEIHSYLDVEGERSDKDE